MGGPCPFALVLCSPPTAAVAAHAFALMPLPRHWNRLVRSSDCLDPSLDTYNSSTPKSRRILVFPLAPSTFNLPTLPTSDPLATHSNPPQPSTPIHPTRHTTFQQLAAALHSPATVVASVQLCPTPHDNVLCPPPPIPLFHRLALPSSVQLPRHGPPLELQQQRG